MLATIISIGDELLIGKVINTNASYLAEKLNTLGIKVNEILSIGDDRLAIINSLKKAHQSSEIILLTGGLGPTSDDITKPALCDFFNTKLVLNSKVLEQIKIFVEKRKGVLNKQNESQAYIPENCVPLDNSLGTAPGLFFEKEGHLFFALPGVPFEMRKIFEHEVVPIIKNRFNISHIYHRTILTTGIAESRLAEIISDWERSLPSQVKLAYLPSPGIVKLRLSVYNHSEGAELIRFAEEKLKPLISTFIFGYDDENLEGKIGELLLSHKATLSTAESCTGGNIAATIISVPGASAYFKGGIIAYSNELKINELKVNPEIIEQHGAVSEPTVVEMVKGCLEKYKSHYALAITGIAGPQGGSIEKPVGTVWIAVATNQNIKTERFQFADDRIRNIQRSTIAALNMLRKFILGIN